MPHRIIVVVLLWLASGAALSQSPQTTFIGDRNAGLDRTTQTADQPRGREAVAFTRQCAAIVGIEPYCACVASRVPAGLTFEQYFIVLGRSREANGYDGLKGAVKQAYDAMPAIRDACAARVTVTP